jgi:glucose-1-phosphate thymidylyltransferase
MQAANFVRAVQQRQGLYIACLEEIAYKRGFISKDELIDRAKEYAKTEYGDYILRIAEGRG